MLLAGSLWLWRNNKSYNRNRQGEQAEREGQRLEDEEGEGGGTHRSEIQHSEVPAARVCLFVQQTICSLSCCAVMLLLGVCVFQFVCVRLGMESEVAAVFCIHFLSSYILPSFLLSFLPPLSHPIIAPWFFSPTQAMTGWWEMMSADLQHSLSAATSLIREYCKNTTRQTSSRRKTETELKKYI